MRRFLAISSVCAVALVATTLVAAQDASPTPGADACATPAASPGARREATPAATREASPMASPTVAGCVAVSLSEFAIDMPDTVAAGPTTFVVTNTGSAEHNFEVEGQGIEEELPRNLMPGETAELTLDLKPGTYEVYCPVDGHKDLGMELRLTVR